MFDIKRARNNFYGFRATIPEAEYDGFMACLELAVKAYENHLPEKLEACQKLIRIMTELAYFDPEKREVHVQLGFRELETFTQAMYDVMLVGYKLESQITFASCLERPETKIWKNRQPAEQKE